MRSIDVNVDALFFAIERAETTDTGAQQVAYTVNSATE